MDAKTFAESFAANIDSNDVAEEKPQDLLLRARNTVDVLLLHRVSPLAIRHTVAEVLSHWTAERLEPLLRESNIDWFSSPKHEKLLRSLFEEMVSYVDELTMA